MKAHGIEDRWGYEDQFNNLMDCIRGHLPPRAKQIYAAAWLEELIEEIEKNFNQVHTMLCEKGFRLSGEKLNWRSG
jgi:hypothetical protein